MIQFNSIIGPIQPDTSIKIETETETCLDSNSILISSKIFPQPIMLVQSYASRIEFIELFWDWFEAENSTWN